MRRQNVGFRFKKSDIFSRGANDFLKKVSNKHLSIKVRGSLNYFFILCVEIPQIFKLIHST